jgi:hypothetical protein
MLAAKPGIVVIVSAAGQDLAPTPLINSALKRQADDLKEQGNIAAESNLQAALAAFTLHGNGAQRLTIK